MVTLIYLTIQTNTLPQTCCYNNHCRFGGYLYAGLITKSVQVGNINFSYFERPPSASDPKNAQTLVFVHGFSANKTMWMVMSKYLPKSWRLVMVDMPGHGDSTFLRNSDYSSNGMADKLDQVRRFGFVNGRAGS